MGHCPTTLTRRSLAASGQGRQADDPALCPAVVDGHRGPHRPGRCGSGGNPPRSAHDAPATPPWLFSGNRPGQHRGESGMRIARLIGVRHGPPVAMPPLFTLAAEVSGRHPAPQDRPVRRRRRSPERLSAEDWIPTPPTCPTPPTPIATPTRSPGQRGHSPDSVPMRLRKLTPAAIRGGCRLRAPSCPRPFSLSGVSAARH